MIKKLLTKINLYFLLVVTIFGNTGLFSFAKTKQVEKDVPPESPSYFTVPMRLLLANSQHFLSDEKPRTKNLLQEVPQSEQIAFLINNTSTNLLSVAVVDFRYTANPQAVISEIQADILEPKDFLARNFNEEWKRKI